MVQFFPAPNGERQRRFRAAHACYNRKYNGHPSKAEQLRIKQMLPEGFALAKAEAHVQLVFNSTICKPLPLMLPAPVETNIIPGMNVAMNPIELRAETIARSRAA